MIKVAYLNCPTGIAGDMCLGALVDLGVPLEYLIEQLKGLGIESEYQLRSQIVKRQGQLATKVNVDLKTHSKIPARHLDSIIQIISQAGLPPRVTTWSQEIFSQLAIAEGLVHGMPANQVHFHEVGATDALVDIVGTCLGLDWLGVQEIYCSPLPTGGGTVKAAHGVLPVPVPAVLRLWESRQVPVYDNGIAQELVTPTGAAIAVTLSQSFGVVPAMQITKVGCGAGSKDFSLPNLLQIWLGEKANCEPAGELIGVLETQVDDLNPQAMGYLFERLEKAGAVDVFTQAVGMKKSRPGILIRVICPPATMAECELILFAETTTLGIRRQIQERRILSRRWETVETQWGPVKLKIAEHGSQILNVQPEYEDCISLARTSGESWLTISQQAIAAWYCR